MGSKKNIRGSEISRNLLTRKKGPVPSDGFTRGPVYHHQIEKFPKTIFTHRKIFCHSQIMTRVCSKQIRCRHKGSQYRSINFDKAIPNLIAILPNHSYSNCQSLPMHCHHISLRLPQRQLKGKNADNASDVGLCLGSWTP